MVEDQEFIDSINRESQAYESVINTSNKAIIILSPDSEKEDQDKEDTKNIIVNFLKEGKLKLENNEYGELYFSKRSPRENIFDSFNQKSDKYLTYKSTYLNNNSTPSESSIDKFFLQKILSTTPTKFILAVKNIETGGANSPNLQGNLKKLANILEKFTKLLENIDISIICL